GLFSVSFLADGLNMGRTTLTKIIKRLGWRPPEYGPPTQGNPFRPHRPRSQKHFEPQPLPEPFPPAEEAADTPPIDPSEMEIYEMEPLEMEPLEIDPPPMEPSLMDIYPMRARPLAPPPAPLDPALSNEQKLDLILQQELELFHASRPVEPDLYNQDCHKRAKALNILHKLSTSIKETKESSHDDNRPPRDMATLRAEFMAKMEEFRA